MIEKSEKQESKEITPKSKLFGLPRPLVGAIIGMLVFALVLFWAWMTETTFLFLMFVPIGIFGINYVVTYVTSVIPLAIVGFLFASAKRSYKILGTFLFGGYLIFSLFAGLFLYLLFFND
jgi:hypothetical protein